MLPASKQVDAKRLHSKTNKKFINSPGNGNKKTLVFEASKNKGFSERTLFAKTLQSRKKYYNRQGIMRNIEIEVDYGGKMAKSTA